MHLRLLPSLLLSGLLLGCAPVNSPPVETNKTSPSASANQVMSRDYCEDLIPSLDSLNRALYRADEDEDFDGFSAVSRAAKQIVTQVEIARRQGLDIDSDEAQWVDALDASAQILLVLIDAGPDAFSDEELDDHLKEISFWFDQAYLECEPFNS